MSALYPNLIVDNAQALYSREIGRAAFYSPRKFFGLPDGRIALFRESGISNVDGLERCFSLSRATHLLKRIDINAEAGYSDLEKPKKRFQGNSRWLCQN